MNYANTKDVYPKAYERFLGWNEVLDEDMIFSVRRHLFRNSNLYRFFDSQNIIIEILAETIDENLTFFYKIYYLRRPPSPLYAIQVNFPNRQEVEQAAFENAFEILERKLS